MSTRFARVVEWALSEFTVYETSLDAEHVVKLLQREHAASTRAARSLKRTGVDTRNLTGMEAHAYRLACDDLLAWLDERGR